MRFPEFLKDKGTIGFAAPSFGCNIEPYRTAFSNSLEKWKAMGYRTLCGPNVYEGSGTGISASPQSCGKELTDMYCSEESDVLISCGGGELMCETLDHVDFDRVRKAAPKWYMGYSDNTNFTFLLTTLCDTASVYGPCAPSFGMEPWHESIEDAYRVLRGEKLTLSGYPLFEVETLKDEEHPLAPYHVTQPRHIRAFLPEGMEADAPVKMSGRLIGGCMDCLVNLLGTCYDSVPDFAGRYKEDGILWFLESCDLNVFAIRRAVWQMQHAGWFAHVKGFLIGRPLVHGQEMMGLDQYRAVTDLLAQYQVPVIMDLDIGHIPPMMPLICGSMAEAELDGQEFSLKMSVC